MAKMIFKRVGLGFVPIDDEAQKFTRRIDHGELIMMEGRRPRNIGQHRKIWKLASLVAENLDGVKPETVMQVIKIRTGHVNILKTKAGEIHVPKSISFESMDQGAFEDFFEAAVRFIVTDILPGVKRAELEQEILDWAA